MENIGCIFDCDGTLVDSVGGWRKAELEFGRLYGAVLTPDDMALLNTYTLPETGVFYHEKFGIGESPQDVVDMVDEILIEFYRTEAQLFPGVQEFLEGLRQAGVPLTVASSSPQRYLQPCFESLGLKDYFTAVLSTDDVGYPKRVPVIYERCAQTMGTNPAMTWGFEDSIYAVRTLVNAGFKCVGCYDRDDSGTIAQMQETATLVITSFAGYSAEAFLEAARRFS